MEVYFLGQASLLIVAGSTRLLCDPWFVGSAHLGSWRPWPTSDAIVREQLALAKTATHIFLSHAHDDHAHAETLREIGPRPILLAAFAHHGIKHLAKRYGSGLIVIADDAPLALGDIEVRAFRERPDYRTNSILTVQQGQTLIVNANDCGLDPDLLTAIKTLGTPTVFCSTLNFAANGYPFPYLKGNEPDFAERCKIVRDQVLEGFVRGVNTLAPRMSIAFAGPVWFQDSINTHLNELPEARDWRAMLDEARAATGREAIYWPAPCSRVTLADGAEPALELREYPSAALAESTTEPTIPATKWNAEDDRRAVGFCKLLASIVDDLNATIGTRLILGICSSLEDVAQHRAYTTCALDFDRDIHGCRYRSATEQDWREPHLVIYGITEDLRAFIRGRVDYDTLLLSYRVRCMRVPDQFNASLHTVLRMGQDRGTRQALLRAAHKHAANEAPITRDHDGHTHTIEPRCPHEHARLDKAPIETRDGHPCIRCPRHNWTFDLTNGACVEGGDPRIKLKIF